MLDAQQFGEFLRVCRSLHAETMKRLSLTPGMYFPAVLVSYFRGIHSERGIARRASDLLAIRQFLHLALDEAAPDHSTISRTQRLIDLETHRPVFSWIQQRLTEAGLLKSKAVVVDATMREADTAMRSIVRRDTGEGYQEFLIRLAQESGIETPTRDDLARLDRRRNTSNTQWTHPHDPDAKVTKLKDGRTHLAHKAEHAVGLNTGAFVAVTLQGADQGDTTILEPATAAARQVEGAHTDVAAPQARDEIVADKSCRSNQTVLDLDALGIRSYIAAPDRGRAIGRRPRTGTRRCMAIGGACGAAAAGTCCVAAARRSSGRSPTSMNTGGVRRTRLRGHASILNGGWFMALDLGLIMRPETSIGTPRRLEGRAAADLAILTFVAAVWRSTIARGTVSRRILATCGPITSTTLAIGYSSDTVTSTSDS